MDASDGISKGSSLKKSTFIKNFTLFLLDKYGMIRSTEEQTGE